MPKMRDINVKKSKYFKVADLLNYTGETAWARAQLNAVIESAYTGKYNDEDEDDAYFVEFRGVGKPLGCNLTIREFLAGMVGDDAEWDSAALGGLNVCIYAEHTSMGPGVRLRAQAPANVSPATPAPAQPPAQSELEPPPPTDEDQIPF